MPLHAVIPRRYSTPLFHAIAQPPARSAQPPYDHASSAHPPDPSAPVARKWLPLTASPLLVPRCLRRKLTPHALQHHRDVIFPSPSPSLPRTNAILRSTRYELPDGRVINVGGERFGAPECLFQPHLVNVDGVGVAELLFNTIQVCRCRAPAYSPSLQCMHADVYGDWGRCVRDER